MALKECALHRARRGFWAGTGFQLLLVGDLRGRNEQEIPREALYRGDLPRRESPLLGWVQVLRLPIAGLGHNRVGDFVAMWAPMGRVVSIFASLRPQQ